MATHSQDSLDVLIQQAVEKIQGKKENDICRYLPSTAPGGGYVHHFTMRKMKGEEPDRLKRMIEKYIKEPSHPQKVTPKQRAARGSRKRRDPFPFSKTDIEKLLSMARANGENEIVRKLTPKKDLRTLKRELISSIRHGRVEEDLWQAYVDTITNQAAFNQANEFAGLL